MSIKKGEKNEKKTQQSNQIIMNIFWELIQAQPLLGMPLQNLIIHWSEKMAKICGAQIYLIRQIPQKIHEPTGINVEEIIERSRELVLSKI